MTDRKYCSRAEIWESMSPDTQSFVAALCAPFENDDGQAERIRFAEIRIRKNEDPDTEYFHMPNHPRCNKKSFLHKLKEST